MTKRWNRRFALAAAAALLAVALLPQTAEAYRGRSFLGDYFNNRTGLNLVERLDRMGQFETLILAVQTAGLEQTLAQGGEFTILAPTDQAFADLLAELGISAEALLASPDLTNILLYHVLPGKQRAAQLVYNNTAATLFDDRPVLVTFDRSGILVNQANLIRPNVRASNGFIQVIDAVLSPPEGSSAIESMVDVLRLDGRFTVLLAALEETGLDEALSGDDELTLFAPTDEAFATLLSDLGIGAGELLGDPNLSQILLYHVAGGSQGALRLLLQGGTTTLQGGTVSVGFSGGKVKINDADLINPNIRTPNGIIHTIDGVLLP